jgi:hypothetical protein
MQTDFILFLRASISGAGHWMPHTCVYATRFFRVFEMFDRAQSAKEFTLLASLLRIKDKKELGDFIEKAGSGNVWVPKFDYDRLDLPTLTGFERLATLP